MKWVPTRQAHLAEHARMLRLEAIDELREATIIVRTGVNEIFRNFEPYCLTNITVVADVRGSIFPLGGLHPEDIVLLEMPIEETVVSEESGVIGFPYSYSGD